MIKAEDPTAEEAGGGTSNCFAFLAKGAKWNVIEPWVINPANIRGLNATFLIDNVSKNIQKWEEAAGFDIMGGGTSTTQSLSADTISPDDQNEIYFADISSGAIAVTIVWGIFLGPPRGRELVEWDQIYNDVDFDWSDRSDTEAEAAGKMDFENIAAHEIGHSCGMGHPDDSCIEETMYRFAAFGETKKSTLEAGDIAGIIELYK